MYKNNNNKIIKELANKHLFQNKLMLMISIIAISITTLLITSISFVGFNMIKAEYLYRQKVFGTKAQCEIYVDNEEESKKIKDNKLVEECGEYKNIGKIKKISNYDLDRRIVDLKYMDNITMKNKFYDDSLVGKLPIKSNEIIIDSLVFDSIGKKFKIKDKINIQYSDINNELFKKEFIITGYYTGNKIEHYIGKDMSNHNNFIVSKKFFKNKLEEFVIEPKIRDFFNLENNIKTILAESGLDNSSDKYNINNPKTLFFENSLENISFMIILISIIVISGYLIIYNIIYISVIRETRFYGLIKTIGITPKQIRKMIFHESIILSCMGISIGLFVGLGSSYLLFKKAYSVADYDLKYFNYSIDLLFIIIAVVFSLLTVLMATFKPLKIASKVSAKEAIRYTGNYSENPKKTSNKYSSKIWYMAYSNIKNNKRKLILVVVSLSLSIILINIVYSITRSFEIDEYVTNNIISDYSIGDRWLYYNGQFDDSLKNAITEELCNEIENIDGVKDFNKIYNFVYNSNGYKDLRDRLYKGHKRISKDVNMTKFDKSEFGTVDIKVYSIDNFVCNYLNKDENLNKLFNTGKYIILSNNIWTGEVFKKDDIIPVEYPNKTVKNYKVLYTIDDIPKCLTTKGIIDSASYVNLYLPEDEFLRNNENANIMTALFNVQENKNEYIEKFLESKVRENYNFDYRSASLYRKEIGEKKNIVMIFGYSFSIIIGFIGILNFTNLICTNIFSKKYELSIMQSIGMTKKQLKKMLSLEGIYYSIFTTFFVVTIGIPISYMVMKLFNTDRYFSIFPVIGMLMVLYVFSNFLPKLIYKTIDKENLVDRIKYTE